jgi:hypothetical protein
MAEHTPTQDRVRHFANLVRSDASDWVGQDPRAGVQIGLCDAAEELADEHEALLRRSREVRDVLRKDGAVFLADHLEQAIEKAEGREPPSVIRAKAEGKA